MVPFAALHHDADADPDASECKQFSFLRFGLKYLALRREFP